jgi:integrase
MSKPLQVIGQAVSRLLAEFEHDPQAVLIALLTLCYGQSLEVTRLARWMDFDLRERVWRAGADRLPLTAQALDLLAGYWSVAGGAGEYLFTCVDGQPLRKSRVACRVLKLSGGVLPLKTLQAWALKGCPDLDSATIRSEILHEFAVRGASVAQVAGLECEFEARMRASVAGWHDVLLVQRVLDEFTE